METNKTIQVALIAISFTCKSVNAHREITFQSHVQQNKAAVDGMAMSGIPQSKFIAYFQATNPSYASDWCEIEGYGNNFGEGVVGGQRVYEADVKCVRRVSHNWHDRSMPSAIDPMPKQNYWPISYLCRLGLAYQILSVAGPVGSTCYLPGLAAYGSYSQF